MFYGVITMATTNINVRLDSVLKNDFDTLCDGLGISMSTAIMIFVKTMVRRRGLPFPLQEDRPNATTLAAMAEADQMLADPNTIYYNSAEELFEARGW